ncbi:MAG TPA: uroporphyrinogen-III synthase [Rhizomicrobium sp.]|nr:uroporphyrinogen-III synthase [Rhizomicrobium sp.]
MRILVTRPLEDGAAIAQKLREMGHQPFLAPLLRFQPIDGPEPDFIGVQAILASSANGIRALARRTARRDLPVLAVGPQTTDEARKAGLRAVKNADGDARALAEAAARWANPANGALLHVCGEEAPGTLADDLTARGFDVRRAVLYRMMAATHLPADAEAALPTLDAVLLFSPRSAKIFADLARDRVPRHLTALCISPATAAVLEGENFAEIRVAARPNQAALLDLV